MSEKLKRLGQEWDSLEKEYKELEDSHKAYLSQLGELERVQKAEIARLKTHEKKFAAFKRSLKDVESAGLSDPEGLELDDLLTEVGDKSHSVSTMLDELPKYDNGVYLNIILGTNIPLSLLRKEDKFRYKDEYEKFKLTVQIVAFVSAAVALIVQQRAVDALFHFLLVWYYCTLTIRESLLRLNGSRIKGWWVAHHYLTTVLCGICLTWPDGDCYRSFRVQFLLFSLYLSVVQWLQVQYQRGILYRLRTLGQSHAMDLTVDGFQSYMFKGLSFILPFLGIAYLFQLYNAYTLFYIYFAKDCRDWQVMAGGVLFLVLALGNSRTTGEVVWRKYADKLKPSSRRRLVTKYSTGEAPIFPKDKET